ncbi:MAG: hypoxanthine phosphoribosyltransferase [Dehalococcoidia bacterium]|nr:hypoxanthine phosphoribosyltransferase [Dehalococcoidia bacterium]
MDKPRVFIPREEIEKKVAELADELRRDYQDKHPLLIGALKGSFVFMSDLIRKLNIPVEIYFIMLSSYGAGRETSGKIKLLQRVKTPIRGRHVLVIEDIIDSGLTVRFLLNYLGRRKPSSLKLCTMFDKPSRRVVEIPIDYVGFTIPDAFVVGYGLDLDEKFRYLPDLCVLEEQE